MYFYVQAESVVRITYTPTEPYKIEELSPVVPYPENKNKLVVKAKDIYGQNAEPLLWYFSPSAVSASKIKVYGAKTATDESPDLRVYKAYLIPMSTDVGGSLTPNLDVAQGTFDPDSPGWDSASLIGTLPSSSRLTSIELSPTSINLGGYTQFRLATENDINVYPVEEELRDVDAQIEIYFY